MTLLSLGIATALVAVLFLAVARVQHGPLGGGAILAVVAEAAAVTLLGSLWFGSLGTGAWWLVFGLVGALASGAERGLRSALLRSAKGPELRGFLVGVAKYVAAGALLAWRLS